MGTDRRLWAVISGGLFAILIAVWAAAGHARHGLEQYVADVVGFALLAVLSGYLLHMVVLAFLKWFTRGPAREDAADYGDAPSPTPPIE